jgi:hypothetical protein
MPRSSAVALILAVVTHTHWLSPSAQAGSTIDLQVPSLSVCAAPPNPRDASSAFIVSRPSRQSVTYQCKHLCPAQDGTQCTYPVADIFHNLLTGIAFVTDQMGGELRWNTTPAPAIAVNYVATASGGDSWQTDQSCGVRDEWIQLQDQISARTIEVKWQHGVTLTPAARLGTGWFSRKDSHAVNLMVQIGRPAAAMKWAMDHLVPSGAAFGTQACSGGSIQTFGAAYWYDLKPDYQYLTGVIPGVWDINVSCAHALSPGICEDDPSKPCTHDSDCSPYFCAHPQPSANDAYVPHNPVVEGAKALVDYLSRTTGRDSCVSGGTSALFTQSSFKTNTTFTRHGELIFPVDMDNGIDGDASTGNDPTKTDTALSVTYDTASLYNLLRLTSSASLSRATTVGQHCSSVNEARYLPATLSKMESAFSILPQANISNNAATLPSACPYPSCSACNGD